MNDDWQDQIADFFDGSPTEEQVRRLNDWIKADPANVRRFVREAIVHNHLHDLLNGDQAMHQQTDERTTLESGETMVLPALSAEEQPDEIDEVFPPAPAIMPQPQPVSLVRRPWFWAASILIPLLASVFVYWLMPRPHLVATVASEPPQHGSTEPLPIAPPPSFATLASVVNVQWGGASDQFLAGQRLPETPLFLQSGFAEIKFDTGAAMIVEAPARFQVRAVNSVELISGQIFAKVPPAARGFAVKTEATRVVDLGTEFGVAASPDGSDEIQVFKGTVRAQPQAAGPIAPLLLSQGQAAVSTGHQIKLDPAGAQPQKFVRQLDGGPTLDLVDLIAGGDGTTHRRGIAIDYQKHAMGMFAPAGTVDGDHQYHRVTGSLVVDGCFIPDGSKGPVEVNSIGQTHVFPSTANQVYDQIWTGGRIPGLATEGPIPTVMAGIDYSQSNHSILFMSSNGGLTIDLAPIQRLHPACLLKRLRCIVGNGSLADTTLADVSILLGDKVVFEQRKFNNRHAPFTVDVPLDPAERFLTFVVTDGGDGIPHDGILWADAKLIGEPRPR